MSSDKNLILIKGEDKTEKIRSWQYNNGRVEITFSNGKTYPYAHYNVEFFKDPLLILPNEAILLNDGKTIGNMKKAQIFEKHIRVIYKTGYTKLFDRRNIQIVKSSLSEEISKNCFEYLKQIAMRIALKTIGMKAF